MATKTKKQVYLFHEGNKDMKDLLGGMQAEYSARSSLLKQTPDSRSLFTQGTLKKMSL